MNPIQDVVTAQKQGKAAGIYSCCSANPYVLKAALYRGKLHDTPVLIEATANQVDQYGGYSGMKPADFYEFVQRLISETGIRPELVTLGGDHLGPLTFADKPEETAMAEASELVRQYVLAGFTKIHLDTSMRLGSDDPKMPLTDETIAARGAALCRAAEDAYAERLSLQQSNPSSPRPQAEFGSSGTLVYIIGSEVPIPGGATGAFDSDCGRGTMGLAGVCPDKHGIAVTTPEACERTISAFRDAFTGGGLQSAWERVVGVVVQPGVEFGDSRVIPYDREKARALTAVMKRYPGMVFEGHSTDYQTKFALREMVDDGIAILKVGPALTFALREALISLELIECELLKGRGGVSPLSGFRDTLDSAMVSDPKYWQSHYHGDELAVKFARMFSCSDRARYYLTAPAVRESIERLIANLRSTAIPPALVSQYMCGGLVTGDPEELLLEHIGRVIDDYLYATINK